MTETITASLRAPRVVPRDAHGISRKDISPNALRVLYRLREGGFAAYLVGGAVRDLLIGGHPKDFDVATDATPEQVKSLFRNCRLIGRRFRLAHVVYGREIIEVATFRANERRRQRRPRDGERGPPDARQCLRHASRTTRCAATSPPMRCTTRSRISRCATTSAASRTCRHRVLQADRRSRGALSRGSGAHAARGAAGGEAGFPHRPGRRRADPASGDAAVRRRAGAPVR